MDEETVPFEVGDPGAKFLELIDVQNWPTGWKYAGLTVTDYTKLTLMIFNLCNGHVI